MAVRLCHPSDFEGGFFYLKNAEEATFGGAGTFMINGFIKQLKSVTNTSLIINRGNGMSQHSNESYNGCIRQLERNESDLVLTTVDYPLDNMNIDQGMVLFETFMLFMQDYFFAHFKTKDVHVLNSLASLFDITHLILSFYATCSLVLVIAEKMVIRWSGGYQRQHLFGNVLLHCTRLGSICDNSSPGYRIIFSCLSIFSLVVIHFYSSSIKTDLVVVEDPEIWLSYDDLIRDRVRPMTVREFNIHSYLRNAPPKSPERKLWDWAINEFGEKALVISASPSTFSKFGNYMQYRRGVAFYDEVIAKMIRETSCNGRRHTRPPSNDPERDYRFQNYNLLLTRDPNAQILTKAVAFSRYFKGRLARKVRSIFRSVVESGIVDFARDFIGNIDLLADLRGSDRVSPEVLDKVTMCKSDYMIRPEKHYTDAIGLKNIKTLAFVYSCLVLACNLVLLFEVVAPKIIAGVDKLMGRGSTSFTGE